jgi:hypothetical protein
VELPQAFIKVAASALGMKAMAGGICRMAWSPNGMSEGPLIATLDCRLPGNFAGRRLLIICKRN